MASSPLEQGTRDECRHCGQRIILLFPKDEGYRRNLVWFHMLPQGKRERQCGEIVDKKHGLGFQRAEPKRWCWEYVQHSAWHSSTCQRPVKDTELFMCGIHARAVKDQKAKEKKRQEDHDVNDFMREGVEAVCKHLLETFELPTRPHYSWDERKLMHVYDGTIRVDATRLLNLLTEMLEEERF